MSAERLVAGNPRARHDYFIDETVEAGLVLKGTEVKSLRAGQASLKEAYCRLSGGEAFVCQMTIPVYAMGNRENHDPTASRKLLLHRRELDRLERLQTQKGLTLVPLRLYFRAGRAKLEIGVARGKKLHDKRESLKEQQSRRETARVLADRAKTGD